MLESGERQVSPKIEGIRRDHTERYEWAAHVLGKCTAIDVACGIGYGTKILAKAGAYITGIDIDEETIAYARTHYSHVRSKFMRSDVNDLPTLPAVDAAVCFEAIEHVEDPRPMLRAMHRAAPLLLASVPNEDEFPWLNYEFHYRHYTKQQFSDLLNETGWEVVDWYGQHGDESKVEPNISGRTLIAVAKRKKEAKPVEILTVKNKVVPESVAILGLGPSLEQYVDIAKRLGCRSKVADEIWGINALGSVIQCDRVFHMDDVRIQQIRSDARPQSNIAAMLGWLKKHPGPIYTSRPHQDYPGMIAFPLQEVLNTCGYAYFNSTAAYAVAYAIHLGVKKISLWGCDFTYPKAHDAEKGRACVEFWLGMASERGIKIQLPTKTTLMDAIHTQADRIYGYDTVDVNLTPTKDGKVTVTFSEKAHIETAEEIEKRYDHNAPTSEQVKAR